MEFPKNHSFPDLQDGIYFFKGGYLVLKGNSANFLRHDNEHNNLQHLIKAHPLKGKLPDKYHDKIQLPKTEPQSGAHTVQALVRKGISKTL
jgi:hypothetical protein